MKARFQIFLLLILCLVQSASGVLAAEMAWPEMTSQHQTLLEQGKFTESRELAEAALAEARSRFGSDHENVAQALSFLGMSYEAMSNYFQAEIFYNRALAMRQRSLGVSHPDVAMDLSRLAALYFRMGNPEAAKELFERSLKILKAKYGAKDTKITGSMIGLAEAERALGHEAAAIRLFEDALEILGPRAKSQDQAAVLACLNHLAEIHQAAGDPGKAERYYQDIVDRFAENWTQDRIKLGVVYNNLGAVSLSLNKQDKAEFFYTRAIEIFLQEAGARDPGTREVMKNLNQLYLTETPQKK